MTQAASVKFSLTDWIWTLQLALSQVMFAAKIFFFVRFIIIHVFNFFLLTLSAFTAILITWWSNHFRLLLYFFLKSRDFRLAVCLHFTFFLLIGLCVVGLDLILEVLITPRLHVTVISIKFIIRDAI